MARRPAPSPLQRAVTHLSTLAAAGTAPPRISREVMTVVDGWRGRDPDRVQEWAAALREDIGVGLADAIDQAESVDASDGAGAAKQAQAVVDALRAALNAIEAELTGA